MGNVAESVEIAPRQASGLTLEPVEAAIVAAVKKHPDLQGPIFRACRDSSRPIPEELLKTFDVAPHEVKLTALQALSPSTERECDLLEKSAVDPDPDLASAVNPGTPYLPPFWSHPLVQRMSIL